MSFSPESEFYRLVVGLLLTFSLAVAYAGEGDNNGSRKPPVEGESLWIEEKINPATRWLENLVSPITTWMEDKIQANDETSAPPPPHWNITAPEPSRIRGTTQELLTDDQAASAVVREYPGEVLRVKFLEKESPVYRVKLITELGEIYILYVDAYSGQILNQP